MKWLNVTGLILEFLAFWFAAPELLGEQSLKGMETALKKIFSLLPLIFVIVIAGGFEIYCFVGTDHTDMKRHTFQIVIASVIYVTIMMFINKIRRFIREKISIPLIDKIINNQEARKVSLLIAGILISLSFTIQLIAILLS